MLRPAPRGLCSLIEYCILCEMCLTGKSTSTTTQTTPGAGAVGQSSKRVTSQCQLYTVRLSEQQWQQIQPVGTSSNLQPGWTDVLYDAFHDVWPTCALAFLTHRNNSRTRTSLRWVAHAECVSGRRGQCVRVKFCINVARLPCRVADVCIQVNGRCTHIGLPSDRVTPVVVSRQLRGSRRQQVASELLDTGQSHSEAYYRRLGDLSPVECMAGNLSGSPSPQVLKQATYEMRKRTKLHHDAVLEVDLQREDFVAAIPADKLPGYIQVIGMRPFLVTLYVQEQLQEFVTLCRSVDGGVMHVDCTGSIIAKWSNSDDKPIYLYSMVMKTRSFPVCDFLTSRHSSSWLTSVMQCFVADVARVNNGVHVRPRAVVTDFSFALLYAVCQAFNGMSLVSYLKYAYSFLTTDRPSSRDNVVSVLCICCAHMTKAFLNRLTKLEKDRNKRKVFMVMFTALQYADSLPLARQLLRDICTVLRSKTCTSAVSDALSRVRGYVEERMPPDNDQLFETDDRDTFTNPDFDDDWPDETNTSTRQTLREKSPFTSYFKDQLPDAEELNREDVEPDDDIQADNDLYCLRASDEILSLIHLFPLWSAAMQKQTYVDDDGTEQVSVQCRSNATVESYFKSVKHGRFKAGRVSPRMFVLNQLKFVNGKLKEACLPSRKRNVLKNKVASITPDETEKWRSKRRKENYHSTAAAKRAFKKMRIPRKKANVASTKADIQSAESRHAEVHENVDDTAPISDDECYSLYPELSSDDIEFYQRLLRNDFPEVHGLQAVSLGACIRRQSVPAFQPVPDDGRFVQIVNSGDHWVCITNRFSSRTHEVYVYDSAYSTVAQSTVLAASALLRLDHSDRDVTFRIRKVGLQTQGTRICGHFAVATCIAVCHDVDVTGHVFDEPVLLRTLTRRLRDGSTEIIPSQATADVGDVQVQVRRKVRCICHEPDTDDGMIQCVQCLQRYHAHCVGYSESAVEHGSAPWIGSCCQIQLTRTFDGNRTHVPKRQQVGIHFQFHFIYFIVASICLIVYVTVVCLIMYFAGPTEVVRPTVPSM